MFNYCYDAIEEFLSNAVYHKSYQIHEPIIVRIESDRIEITSAPRPDNTLSNSDIQNLKMRPRRYRNRRLTSFLKDLKLFDGRNTDIPTTIKAIRNNVSPLPIFLTDDKRSFFNNNTNSFWFNTK